MRILITGGAGFIGSNFVRFMVENYPNDEIINLDKLTYAGNLDNLKDLENKKNYRFIKADICDFNKMTEVLRDVDVILHLAAESHVDNSIGNSLIFTYSNAYGTHILLEAARQHKHIKRIVHVSTDEVYGDILDGSFKENDKLSPNNPYSASKAAAEMIVQAYIKTYNMPILIVRGNNVFGPYQYPEKIISRFVTNLLDGEKVPLHGNGSNIRTYIFVKDFCGALRAVFEKGVVGEIYNIGTSDEISNLELTKKLLKLLNKDESFINFVADRPFNDKRYSVDISKLKSLGWEQKYKFDDALKETVDWYSANKEWWKKVKLKSGKL